MTEAAPLINELPEEEDAEEAIQLQVQNIVATVNLDTELDLQRIAETARNAEYNPQRFQAVILRIREPRTTALIFKSGKMIVTGAKSQKESSDAAKKYVAIIQKVGFPARYKNFSIQNMTATCDVGFPIRLEGFLYANANHATYEPELFPGLVYRMAVPKVVLLIFVSGKVVITGAKNEDDLSEAIEQIYDKLLEFRKKNIVVTAKKA
eukprot:gene256-275_t